MAGVRRGMVAIGLLAVGAISFVSGFAVRPLADPPCAYLDQQGHLVQLSGSNFWVMVPDSNEPYRVRVMSFFAYNQLLLSGHDPGLVVAECHTDGDGRWHFHTPLT